jgi:hypothetical protein
MYGPIGAEAKKTDPWLVYHDDKESKEYFEQKKREMMALNQ